MHGTNDFGEQRWRGPNPPDGQHRYRFRVYALDNRPHAPGITKPDRWGRNRSPVRPERHRIRQRKRQVNV